MQTNLQQEHFKNQHQRVIIIGAGCFGLSTAYHLLIRGYTNITILDRSTVLPAPDASSNDINRSECPLSDIEVCMIYLFMIPAFVVVRSSYNDKFYAELAREAINAWKDRRFWGDTYHEYVFLKIREPLSTGLRLHRACLSSMCNLQSAFHYPFSPPLFLS